MTVVVENFRLTAALGYAALGWRVFPLHWPKIGTSGTGCSCGDADCGSVGKHPLTPSGLLDASVDPAVLREWWKRWPGANVGVVTGADSGIVVLDVDPRDGGDASLAELADAYGQPPETVEAHTGGGGLHLFFRHPGAKVKNSTSRVGVGLDVRGDGGYVVAAPSQHASAKRYAWAEGAGPDVAKPAPMPDWLLVLASEPPPVVVSRDVPRVNGDGAGFWLNKALAKAQPGNRNETGLWLACQLRDARISRDEAERTMLDYADNVPRGDRPYAAREAMATVRHVFRAPPREPAKGKGAAVTLKIGAAQPKPSASISVGPANAAEELSAYYEDVIAGRVCDARLPWPLLTKLSCSMLPGSVTTVCGEPGVGKTFWTLECLRFWHGHGHDPAAYFIEKNRRFHSMRLLAQLEGSGKFIDHDWIHANGAEVREAMARHADYITELGKFIHTSDGGRTTLDGLLAWVRQMASAGKRVLIVDPITAVDAGTERWLKDDEFMVEAQRICAAHNASLLLVTHPRRGARSDRGSTAAHDQAGGAAYSRFADTNVWISRPKKPRRVWVKCVSSVGMKTTAERVGLFVQLHKTRNGVGNGVELAYSWGDGLHFSELGIVTGEVRENNGGEPQEAA